MTKKDDINSVTMEDIENIEYEVIAKNDLWRVEVIKELTDVKFGRLEIDGFTDEECYEILHYTCTS